jgi:hypothetical protein
MLIGSPIGLLLALTYTFSDQIIHTKIVLTPLQLTLVKLADIHLDFVIV